MSDVQRADAAHEALERRGALGAAARSGRPHPDPSGRPVRTYRVVHITGTNGG
ncbi:hypothetical protein [Microbacterium sp.]|uniref:hypothetical protein n=1 Tax=Microbacterium sp. TaxID=51671 RepID=UPI003A90024D